MTEQKMKHATLTEALAAFQADLPKVGKGGINPHFKSKYADLADVVAVVLPALARQGLAWVAAPTLNEHGFVLRYELRHEGGETIGGEWPLPDPSTPSQQLGSAVTYAKRYTLSAVTGIAPDEDDDGNSAQAATRKPAAPRVQAPVEWRKQIADMVTVGGLNGLYEDASRDGWLSDEVLAALSHRKTELLAGPEPTDA